MSGPPGLLSVCNTILPISVERDRGIRCLTVLLLLYRCLLFELLRVDYPRKGANGKHGLVIAAHDEGSAQEDWKSTNRIARVALGLGVWWNHGVLCCFLTYEMQYDEHGQYATQQQLPRSRVVQRYGSSYYRVRSAGCKRTG